VNQLYWGRQASSKLARQTDRQTVSPGLGNRFLLIRPLDGGSAGSESARQQQSQ
jgi:hypothetical protein